MADCRSELHNTGLDLSCIDGGRKCVRILDTLGTGGSCIAYRADISEPGFLRKLVVREFYPKSLFDAGILDRKEDGSLVRKDPEHDGFEQLKEQFLSGVTESAKYYEEDPDKALAPYLFIGEGNGTIYVAVDLGDGSDLEKAGKNGFTIGRTIEIMQSLCSAVGRLHEKNRLYLDIKPENIYLSTIDGHDHVKLFDFDTVVSVSEIQGRKNRFCTFSEGWAPPEQEIEKGIGGSRYRSTVGIDKHSDIYSVGAVFFWLLTGRNPKQEDLKKIRSGSFEWENGTSLCRGLSRDVLSQVNSILHDTLLEDWRERRKFSSIWKLKDRFGELAESGIIFGTENSYPDKKALEQRYTNALFHNYREGLDKELLPELVAADPKGEWRGNGLSEVLCHNSRTAAQPDQRIWLKGNYGSGRTAHMFNFWEETLTVPVLAEQFRVIYLSSEKIGENGLYFQIAQECGYVKETEKALDYFQKYKAETAPRKIVLMIDDYEMLIRQGNTATQQELKQIITGSCPVFDGTVIIVASRFSMEQVGYQYGSHGFREFRVDSLDLRRVNRYLSAHGLDSIDRHNAYYLIYPFHIKLLQKTELKNIMGNVGRLRREAINTAIASMDRDTAKHNILRFIADVLLPLAAFLCTDDRTLEINLEEEKTEEIITGYLSVSPKARVRVSLQELLTNHQGELLFYLMENYLNRLDYFQITEDYDGDIYRWRSSDLYQFFYAEGFLLCQRFSLYKEAVNRATAEITEGLQQIVEMKELHKSLELTDIYDKSGYIFDLEEFLLKPDETRGALIEILAGYALASDIFGYERKKYDAAARTLFYYKRDSSTLGKSKAFPLLCSTAYMIVKCSPEIDETKKYAENLDNAEKFILEAVREMEGLIENGESAFGDNGNNQLSLAKMYGDLGAVSIRRRKYQDALKWHRKSLTIKENVLEEYKMSPVEQDILYEGIRRSYTGIATSCFYLGKIENQEMWFKESFEWNRKAYRLGEEQNLDKRYENYVRAAGAKISFLESGQTGGRDADIRNTLGEILYLQRSAIQTMKEFPNQKELEGIITQMVRMLSLIGQDYANVLQTGQISSTIIDICKMICRQYKSLRYGYPQRLTDEVKSVLNYSLEELDL